MSMDEIKLSPTEQAIVDLLAQGKARKQIARAVGMSPNTLAQHLFNARAKYCATGNEHLLFLVATQRAYVRGVLDTLEKTESAQAVVMQHGSSDQRKKFARSR